MTLYTQLATYSQLIKPNKTIGSSITQISGSWMDKIFGFGDNSSSVNNIFNNINSNADRQDIIRQVLQENAIYDPQTGLLRTPVSTYQAGWFITPTVREIQELVAQLRPDAGVPNVAVIRGKDIGLAHIEAQQFEVFQGASQFNALEMINIDTTPYDGIEVYINDNTQGPRTALSCAPGTFVRNYYITTIYGSQFNALEYLKISHLNGYLIWGTSPQDIEKKINHDNVMIPCMIYTQVVGVTKSNAVNKHVSQKLVHQIYSSAAPVNSYRNGGDRQTQLNIASKILTAQYTGIIGMGLLLHTFDKARTQLKRPRINLTMVGGGVFNVPDNIIIDAISKAIAKYNKYTFDLFIHGYSAETANTIKSQLNVEIVGDAISDITKQSQIQIPNRPKANTPTRQVLKPQPSINLQPLVQIPTRPKANTPTRQILNTIQFPINLPDEDRYVLIIPGANKITVFPLRDYQKGMLDLALKSKDGDYPIETGDVSATIFVRTYPGNEKLIGFVGDDGIAKYFVDIKNNDRINGVKKLNDRYILYDDLGQEIKSWP